MSTNDPVAHIPPLAEPLVHGAAIEALDEVRRQDLLAREGRFGGRHTLPGGTDFERYVVLAEEVGEVATEVNDGHIDGGAGGYQRRTEQLRKELVQVAACAVAWVAAIDDGRPG